MDNSGKKVCLECREELPIEKFPEHLKRGKKARRPLCRECFNERSKGYNKSGREKRFKENPEKVREQKRQESRLRNQRHPEKMTAQTYKYWGEHPERYGLQNIVRLAVERGEIHKPGKCSMCPREGCKIEAHHPDYTKPLEVVWLCSSCHKKVERRIVECPSISVA